VGSPSVPSGLLPPWGTWGQYNNLEFIIQQLTAKMQTATIVKVISCTNNGGVSPIGTVNVQPQVNQTDSNGNAFPHTTIFNVPYLRIQGGGGNAIILDPTPGDLGICLFASRDLSKVISTQANANPGSNRRYDYSDGLYIGACLSKVAPAQYVQFSSAGITIVSPSAITLQAPTINLQGAVSQTNGTMTAQTDVVANGISLHNHTHTSEAEGDPTSPPLP
jgi:Phage protein Gp138 N-terminal domain